MITRRKLKIRALIMLFWSIVLFVSAFVVSSSIENYNSPEKVTRRLQKEIDNAFSDLTSEIAEIEKQDLEDRNSFLEFLNRNYKNAFSGRGIEILVYTNDSLKYWTCNVFATPSVLNTFNKQLDAEVVKTGSGYYILKRKQVQNHSIVAIQLLKYNYKYTNDYLPTGFNKRFGVPENTAIDMQLGKYQIFLPDGRFLFSLNFCGSNDLPLWAQYLIFIIYISSYLCLVTALFAFHQLITSSAKRKWLYFLIFILAVASLRVVQTYFRFPLNLYQIQFFNPEFFASSDFLPSLGDLLINAFLGLQLAYLTFKHFKLDYFGLLNSKNLRLVLPVFFLLITILSFSALTGIISGLVLNSSISFQFENILGMHTSSHLGMIAIALLLNCFLFAFHFYSKVFLYYFNNVKLYSVWALIVALTYIFYSYFYGGIDFALVIIILVLFGVFYFIAKYFLVSKSWINRLIPSVIILSVLGTFLVNKAETAREHEKRILLATRLSDARDNLAEYYFNEVSKVISRDEHLSDLVYNSKADTSQTDVANYIQTKYFSGFWTKYLIQITVCEQEKKLSIQPGNVITNCEDYFEGKITQFMQPVSVAGLYFLRQSVDAMYYLGEINIKPKGKDYTKPTAIFIEISSNDIWKGLGYPELLIDNINIKSDNYAGYSYAFYNNGELVKNVGKFSYDIINTYIIKQFPKSGFLVSNGFSHYAYLLDKNSMVVISKENPQISDLVTPFSYLFLLQLFILLIIKIISGGVFKLNINVYTFRFRLQIILISVIVISSIILVTVSLLFINKLNSNKNNEILNEKLNSILIDIESRYGSVQKFDSISKSDLSELLRTLSNTYFSDINIFDKQGTLLASSREQIFLEGMISEQINFEGAIQLLKGSKTFFIQKESIGNYAFLSAYTPIRNSDNQLLGFLNLPYFARQEEIRREISGLITAFANIYLVMIVITVLLALVLAKYVAKPLQQIGIQFSRFKIGNVNAKIDWDRKDEIGQLVGEYNRMVDELDKSAQLLAKSERESAWREMAKQVAHEIKNPLTPIKLSMQLLMRAWDDKAPDWDKRLKRFSQTLIMQIDTLSAIATEFSDFAQMPEPLIQTFDIIPLVQQAEALFHNQSFCRIEVESSLDNCFIKADPNQILRVFNNLIKNALQSIPSERHGLLRITLTKSDGYCEIKFQDNGTGIATESQAKIFSPNFTTKTAGMGLGLAMVKNIIDSIPGQISFETIPAKGTTFIVLLPVENQELMQNAKILP